MKARTIRRRSTRQGLSDPRSPKCAAAGRALLPPAAAAAVVLAVSLLLVCAPVASAGAAGLAGLGLGVHAVRRRRRRTALPAEARARALAELARALEPAGEAFLVLGPDARVRLANAAAAELIGCQPAALRGRSAAELLRGDAACGAELAASLVAGRPWRRRFTPLSSRGELQVEASFAPLHDPEGRLEGGVGLLRDVTREARRESGTQRSQKLQTLGQLAAGIVHDFNNLLLVIEGYARHALSHAGETGEPRQALLQIRRAVRHAAELTTQVMAFGRRRPGRPRVVPFDEVLRAAMPLLRQMLRETIALDLETGAKGRRVRVDPGQLERLLLNLAANARDAMPGGGQLSIRSTGVASADPASPVGSVLLEVSDTGVGMDEAACEQIFEPFYSSKEEGGAGLGLGSVLQIVEECGGRIEVHTCLGEGTRFRIQFPATEEPVEPRAAPAPSGTAPPRGDARVLVVEDDEAVRELIGHQLRRAGFAVESAPDGSRALERLAAGPPPDVLVSDLSLPGTDGPTLARHLRERRPDLCVLYMSGYPADERVAPATGDPLTELLAKPFAEEQLVARIGVLLARRAEATQPGETRRVEGTPGPGPRE